MKLISVVVSLLFGNQAIACPELIGTWKSSKEMSHEYNKKLNLKNSQHEVLGGILGVLELTYTDENIHSHGADPVDLDIEGKKHKFNFEDLKYDYKVLSCKGSVINTKQFYPYGKPIKVAINFIDKDTYWVTDPRLPTAREYFKRVQ